MITTISGYVLIAVFFSLDAFLRKDHAARSLKPNKFDRGTAILSAVGYPLAIFLPPILNHFSIGRFPFAILVGTTGVVMMVFGLVIRIWSMQTLGRFFTHRLTTLEGQEVIQDGPYHLIRHPGYLGTLLIWTGLPISQANWLATGMVLLVMGISYGRRIKSEEAMLLQEFGEAYRHYIQKTWRLVPWLF